MSEDIFDQPLNTEQELTPEQIAKRIDETLNEEAEAEKSVFDTGFKNYHKHIIENGVPNEFKEKIEEIETIDFVPSTTRSRIKKNTSRKLNENTNKQTENNENISENSNAEVNENNNDNITTNTSENSNDSENNENTSENTSENVNSDTNIEINVETSENSNDNSNDNTTVDVTSDTNVEINENDNDSINAGTIDNNNEQNENSEIVSKNITVEVSENTNENNNVEVSENTNENNNVEVSENTNAETNENNNNAEVNVEVTVDNNKQAVNVEVSDNSNENSNENNNKQTKNVEINDKKVFNSRDTAWKRKAETIKNKSKHVVKITRQTKNDKGDVNVQMVEDNESKAKKEAKLKKRLEEVTASLKENIEAVESKGDYLKIKNIADFYNGSDNYKEMFGYLTSCLFIPFEHIEKFSSVDLVHEITQYAKYNPYDSPDVTMQHDIAEMYVSINYLNKLFKHTFIDFETSNNSPIFSNIDSQIVNFIHSKAEVPTTKIEYMLIKSFMSKLILALTTSTERAFKSDSHIYIDSSFKQAIIADILQLDRIQNVKNGKTFLSWKHFQEELFGMVFENNLYKFVDNAHVNNCLASAYKQDGFQLECLLANILKTYLPSIALNYFYAIKSMYILARLFGIYTYEGLYKNKPIEDIMSDLKIIANSAVILYECKGQMMKQIVRSMPKLENDETGLTQQSQAYFLSHLFTGPHYYLFKHLEYVFPVLANVLAHN